MINFKRFFIFFIFVAIFMGTVYYWSNGNETNTEIIRIWEDRGTFWGMIISIFVSLVTSITFYFLIGYLFRNLAEMRIWVILLFLNMTLVFIITLLLIGFWIFEVESIEAISSSVWKYSVLNSVRSLVIYVFLSVFFRRFSKFCKNIPPKIT